MCISDTACDRYRNETAALRKYITKFKNMRKWIVEFVRKSERRGDKIALVNSIRITKSINLYYFCTLLGSIVIVGDFPCTVHL